MRKVVFRLILLVGISYGENLYECFQRAERIHGVPQELLLAIAKTESSLNPRALNKNRNGTYDIGIMQVNTSNIKLLKRAGIIEEARELWIPCKNIEAGAYILKLCIKRYGLNWKAVDCYNKGRKAKGTGGYVWRVYKYLKRILKD